MKASPGKALEKMEMVGNSLHLMQKNVSYLKLRIEEQREASGISISTYTCGDLFDEDTQNEADKILE